MPVEYVRIGSSKYSFSSENCLISSTSGGISSGASPRSWQLITAFSRPVNSGWKPTPSSSSPATRPLIATVPVSGVETPSTIFSSVLLPAPL